MSVEVWRSSNWPTRLRGFDGIDIVVFKETFWGYEKKDSLSVATIIMRLDWLAVKSNEWEVMSLTPWKEELGLFGFDPVYSYVITYLISDLVLGYISLFVLLCVLTEGGGILVVNRMGRFILSWQDKILASVGRLRDSGLSVVLG